MKILFFRLFNYFILYINSHISWAIVSMATGQNIHYLYKYLYKPLLIQIHKFG